MKLKREISSALYSTIRDKYEDGLYRDAILAALFHLHECIRQRGNLSREQLPAAPNETMLHLFNGAEPTIKLNRMTTLAEVLEQVGFGQMLLGLYHGIKYPRIHADDGFDDEKTANAIIVFVDYLLTRVSGADLKTGSARIQSTPAPH